VLTGNSRAVTRYHERGTLLRTGGVTVVTHPLLLLPGTFGCHVPRVSFMVDPSLHLSPVPGEARASVSPTSREPSFALAPSTTLLRVTRNSRRLDAWTLALTSKRIAPLLFWVDGAFELHVGPDQDVAAAEAELDAIDAEEHEARRAALADAARERTAVAKHAVVGALLVSLFLLAFFAVTGPRADGSRWFAAGASDAERVLHGEWWRAVTALTLHADGAHVLSNVGIGTLVIGAVMRSEGIGWGAALVLASGTTGNLLNAWAHQTLHRSVGFSTAVFGAIGILGGLAYVHARRRASPLRPGRPAWTALAGTLALLALLGTSEKSNVDMLAHLLGGVAGLGLGLLTAWTRWRPTSASGQWLSGLGVVAAVWGAWLIALA
jgi:rhomboid protease GluP